ncbi:MAG TPA: hypothetical protein ENK66_10995 [Arcobacter sp.]|nr:hypothetical protein [Arcobacter sp.]
MKERLGFRIDFASKKMLRKLIIIKMNNSILSNNIELKVVGSIAPSSILVYLPDQNKYVYFTKGSIPNSFTLTAKKKSSL